jgi:four helix bundle protein
MNHKNYDIHERIFNFVISVVEFLSKIPKTSTNLIFIGQCTRSVTSMGANDQEADGALTKKDFIHKFADVRKEGKETIFWLRVVARINSKSYLPEGEKLISEGNEIVAIVSTIMKNAANSKKERK